MVSILLFELESPENHELCIEALNRFTPEEHELISLPQDQEFNSSRQINQGLDISSKSSHKLIMTDSVIVSEGWLGKLLDALNSDDRIGIVSSPIGVEPKAAGERSLVLAWQGGIALIRNDVASELGSFDTRLRAIFYSMNDYYMKLILSGRLILDCPDLEQRCLSEPYTYQTIDCESEAVFKELWGFVFKYSAGFNTLVNGHINRHRKAPIKALDIGCACGGTLMNIKSTYPNAELYGVELNPSSARIASAFANVNCISVEDENALNFPDGFFDVINCGDVLEHLVDPWTIMKRIHKILRPGGRLLINLPNVSHFSVVNDILNCDFRYTSAGLLDKTHLRFFGYLNALSLATDSGFRVLETKAIIIDPRGQHEQDFLDKLHSITDPELHRLYTVFQFFIVCTPE